MVLVVRIRHKNISRNRTRRIGDLHFMGHKLGIISISHFHNSFVGNGADMINGYAVRFAAFINKLQFPAGFKPFKPNIKRQSVRIAEILLELNIFNRITGVIHIHDKLFACRLAFQYLFAGIFLGLKINRFQMVQGAVFRSFANGIFPIIPENAFINPISRET